MLHFGKCKKAQADERPQMSMKQKKRYGYSMQIDTKQIIP